MESVEEEVADAAVVTKHLLGPAWQLSGEKDHPNGRGEIAAVINGKLRRPDRSNENGLKLTVAAEGPPGKRVLHRMARLQQTNTQLLTKLKDSTDEKGQCCVNSGAAEQLSSTLNSIATLQEETTKKAN
jgi:hypothetical protein